jgi:hypothetical protein
MIDTLASDGSDQPFGKAILAKRPGGAAVPGSEASAAQQFGVAARSSQRWSSSFILRPAIH